jgi:hypothetical protein
MYCNNKRREPRGKNTGWFGFFSSGKTTTTTIEGIRVIITLTGRERERAAERCHVRNSE